MRVRDTMTSTVQTCRPEDTLEQAARKLWQHDCGSLPVAAVCRNRAATSATVQRPSADSPSRPAPSQRPGTEVAAS